MTEAESDDLAVGRWLFSQTCTFVAGADTVEALPPIGLPEIAFAGRSNVGKSSLINALTGRKTLARTSNTPGRTQQLNFFDLGHQLQIVDMPGYGYAAVGRAKVEGWTRLARDFLRGRTSLIRVFVLIDGRHGPKAVDHESMDALDKAAVSYTAVLTKADDVKRPELDRNHRTTVDELRRHTAAFPVVEITSSDTGAGIPELRAGIVRAMRDRGFDPAPGPDQRLSPHTDGHR